VKSDTSTAATDVAANDVMASLAGVTRRFGPVTAVDDVTLEVPPGSIIGLIGPSGGGKTTLLRILSGLDQPSSGTARCLGKPTSKLKHADRARLAMLAQAPAVMDEFSIHEQLRFQARLRGADADVAVFNCLERVGLLDARDTRLSDASGGMRRRTGLAAALVGDPDLVFCDEPTAGLDPIARDHIWNWFRSRRSKGRTMVVTTQHIDEASRCDRVIVLREGRAVADAEPSTLAREAGLDEELIVSIDSDERARAMALIGPDVGVATITSDGFVVATTNASVTAGAVAGLLAAADIEVIEMDTRVPDLDAVFRSLVESSDP